MFCSIDIMATFVRDATWFTVIYRKHFQQSVVVRLPYTPFVAYTFHYILGNYFHNLHLILPCVSFLCILLSVFYVLIHALYVSVHFRAISTCSYNNQKFIKGVLQDILLS